jgi:hypothetical protein
MEMKRSHMWRSIVCLTALLALMVSAPLSADDNGKRQDGQGKYARWTAEWWQWIFSLPVSDNPLFDETGARADTAQPNPKAFYLVGVINQSNTASRSITIPRGTPLFGPVINFQNDNIAYDPPVTVPQLRADAAVNVDTAEYFLELDGEPRPDLVARIKSPVFDYVLPEEDNIYQFFDTDIFGRIKPAVSDGYWFYIPPLPPGTHALVFGGSFPNLGFELKIEYEITVE